MALGSRIAACYSRCPKESYDIGAGGRNGGCRKRISGKKPGGRSLDVT
jgi:hypothetical protein